MALLDDLKGILSPAEFAKIQGNPAVATSLARGQELISFYDGDEPPASTVVDPPPARSTPPPAAAGQFDLSALDRMLDAKIGKINDLVDARVADVVKTRGDELVNSAVGIAVRRADELNRIYGRHEREVGKPFDSADFNAFLDKPENKARGYRSITEAYEAYEGPVVQERTIESEVEKRVKARSGSAGVPGTTPAPATNSNIRMFINRGKTGADGAPTTGAGRAAAMLDRMQSRQLEMAS
jgi:hypothetical protein